MLQNSIENMHVECNEVNEENPNCDSCCPINEKVVIHQQPMHETSDSKGHQQKNSLGVNCSQVESIYRLRMSSWCYSICDYIGASRHIVAVAFNYLDRFLEVEKYSW